MFLSKRSNGVYYLFFFDDLGKRRGVSTGCSHKSDALKFLREHDCKRVADRERQRNAILSTFTADYLRYSESVHRPKSRDTIKASLREMLRICGDLPLRKIGVREVETFLATKRTEASEVTAHTYFVTLASAFETAKRWGLVAENIFRQVPKPKLREVQPTYLSREELKGLLERVQDATLKDLFLCALATGMRLGELTSLKWEQVDFTRRIIFVQNTDCFTTKSQRNRVVPMNDQICSLLADRKAGASCPWVFHRDGRAFKNDYVSKFFKRHARKAGLREKTHFHSLRHTFATWLVLNGVPIFEVQKLMGHSSIAMTQRYAHMQPEQLHGAVNKLQLLPAGE